MSAGYRFPFRVWSPPRLADAVERLEDAVPTSWVVAHELGALTLRIGDVTAIVHLLDDDEDEGCASAVIEAGPTPKKVVDAVRQALDSLVDGLGGARDPDGETMARLVREAARSEAVLDTFDEVRDWLAEGFELQESEEDLVAVAWTWDDTERTQLVVVEPAEYLHREWLQISSQCCPAEKVSAERMIDLGGLANAVLEDGVYSFVVIVPYGLDAAHLLALIDHVAALADDLEEELVGTDEY